MTSRRRARSIAASLVAALVCTVVAGCSAPHSAAGPSASAFATARPIGTRVDVPCSTLVPDSVLSVYGRTFRLDASAARTPEAGTPAATIAGQRGRVCSWRSTSGDVLVTVAVAHLPEAALTNLKNALYERSHSVPTYTVEGYFAMQGKVGRADSFPDPYWVDAESTLFSEPGAAQPVMDAIRAALAHG